jgi:hypothetical protein
MLYATYAAWIDGVRDWLDADHLTDAQVGSYISLAQNRLNRELNAWEMEATSTPVSVSGAVSLPANFNRIRQVSIAGVGTYDASTKGEIVNMTANKDETRRLFAIDAGTIILYPTIGNGVTVTIDYYAKVPEISSGSNTNIFTTNYSDVMLWASLVEGSNFIVEDDRGAIFEAKYQTALQQSNLQPNKVKLGSTPLRRFVRSA